MWVIFEAAMVSLIHDETAGNLEVFARIMKFLKRTLKFFKAAENDPLWFVKFRYGEGSYVLTSMLTYS